MLHIVQVVLSGSAEAPKVYLDEAAAQAAFVECAKTYWAQSYAAYCERNGVDCALFSSAQAFIASLDLADRSRIHYWALPPEDAGAAGMARLPGLAELNKRREEIELLVRDVEQASGVVSRGLTDL